MTNKNRTFKDIPERKPHNYWEEATPAQREEWAKRMQREKEESDRLDALVAEYRERERIGKQIEEFERLGRQIERENRIRNLKTRFRDRARARTKSRIMKKIDSLLRPQMGGIR
jgi:hypothetical protein